MAITDDDLPPHLRNRTGARAPLPEVRPELPRDPEQAPHSDTPPSSEPAGSPFLRRD